MLQNINKFRDSKRRVKTGQLQPIKTGKQTGRNPANREDLVTPETNTAREPRLLSKSNLGGTVLKLEFLVIKERG